VSATAATIDGHGGGEAAPVSAYHESLLRSPLFLGMIMFLGSEIMLFGSFFTIFFYLRFTHHPWPPVGIDVPKKPTGINTAILISSSFTMHWALLALQVHEYLHLGFTPSTNAYASGFFSLTGLHGFHVFVGATLLSIALLRAIRGHYSAGAHIGLEVTGLYWHFVDVVWIVLYTVVYLL
jgi:cytochrome c oxidase subunit III